MTNDVPLIFQKALLEIEYRTLCKVREQFPKKSNHKAVEYIEKELTRILNALDLVNIELKKLRL